MSVMSQLHAELSEQAYELGFESLEEALANGYKVDYEKGKLVRRGLGYSEAIEYLVKEQDKAHEAWLKERDRVLDNLAQIRNEMLRDNKTKWAMTVGDTILFVRKGEM